MKRSAALGGPVGSQVLVKNFVDRGPTISAVVEVMSPKSEE